MHIPDETQVLLIAARFTYRRAPFLNRFENLGLDSSCPDRWPLGKPAHQLIEKIFGANLEMKWVTAVLDTDIEQIESKEGDVGVPVVYVSSDGRCRLAWRNTLLTIDKVGDLEIEGKIRLVILGAASSLNEALELCGSPTKLAPTVAGRRAGRCCLHD